jgi:hypothetical protein
MVEFNSQRWTGLGFESLEVCVGFAQPSGCFTEAFASTASRSERPFIYVCTPFLYRPRLWRSGPLLTPGDMKQRNEVAFQRVLMSRRI